jgi:hypothetical protein
VTQGGHQGHLFVPVDLAARDSFKRPCIALGDVPAGHRAISPAWAAIAPVYCPYGPGVSVGARTRSARCWGPEPAKAAAPRRCREQVPIFLGEYELPEEGLVFGPAVSFHGRPPFC